ncbi:hypothetical protein BU16DRAFT_537621 [Lophium mytilinum]|uniref:Uncharacterized protein n=1 Tax=Lophium mytilinum TaxID=390894 RepID=A0A6A6QZX6_9PEZI|nr:hypothetical protein BU16DRAFT_537621 [Lophium mytilinum]
MGNTISKGNEVYFFLDPEKESRKRRDLFVKAQEEAKGKSEESKCPTFLFQKSLLPELLFQKSLSPELEQTSEEWKSRDRMPVPELFLKQLSPELSGRPSQAETTRPTILTCYEVTRGQEKEIWWPLVTLTRVMRVPRSEDLMPVDPRLIFHLRADLDNPTNNGFLSTIFDTKLPWKSIRDVGATEKSFIHVFEPDGQAPDFATVLEELVQKGALHRSTMRFDNNMIECLQTLALFWAKASYQGIDPVGGDEITKGIEEIELEFYEKITRPCRGAVEWFSPHGDA